MTSKRTNIQLSTKSKKVKSETSSVFNVSPYFNNDVDSQDLLPSSSSTTTYAEVKGKRNHKNDEVMLFASTYKPSLVHLGSKFFNQSCIELAKSLLGKILVRKVDGKRLSGIIVETESYLGGEDKASHSYNGKRTPRNEPMYMKPGTSYVYPIYGMYYCFNISSQENGSCVLIRALQPVEGLSVMQSNRQQKNKPVKVHKSKHLCDGPSKLCNALVINKEMCNKIDLASSTEFWLEEGLIIDKDSIIVCKRIGIESSGEIWANKPLRFYIYDNECVSVRDKVAERNHQSYVGPSHIIKNETS